MENVISQEISGPPPLAPRPIFYSGLSSPLNHASRAQHRLREQMFLLETSGCLSAHLVYRDGHFGANALFCELPGYDWDVRTQAYACLLRCKHNCN